MFNKYVDMKRSAEEKAEDRAEMMTGPIADVNDYPYGLSLCFDDEVIEKLEIDDEDISEAEVGDLIHFSAFARVTCKSVNERDGKKCRRIELQITELSVEDENTEDEEED